MAPSKRRDAKKHAKAKARCCLKARQRLGRDRVQAQQAVTVLEQALDDWLLPTDLVAEIEGRLRSQQKLLGQIVGMMFPPLFGCRTNFELCRVRGWDRSALTLAQCASQAVMDQATPTLGLGRAGPAVDSASRSHSVNVCISVLSVNLS